MRMLVIGIAGRALLSAGPAQAQMTIIQGSDGTSGTVINLGNGFQTYSDSHGNTGTIMDLGGGFQTYRFSSPGGQSQSGSVLSLGVPAPPQGMTPAFILPIRPTGPITRPGAVAPVVQLTPGLGAGGALTPGVGVFGSGRGR
ncbi:MAG: hypothetical protein ACREIL_02425 [Nitrospiraceae bacterium]